MENIRFAFISDGDIFHYMTIPNNEDLQGVIAGLRSRPTIVEVPGTMPEIMPPGMKYIDGEFVSTVAHQEDDYEVE